MKHRHTSSTQPREMFYRQKALDKEAGLRRLASTEADAVQ